MPESVSTGAKRLFRLIMPLAAFLLFGLAILILHRSLQNYHLSDLRSALHSLPPGRILLCLLLTVGSYLCLGGYDALALRYIGRPLAYWQTLPASFVSYAFANNTGSLSIIASSSVRYRFYGALGMNGEEITRIIGFCALSFWLGVLALGGTAFLVEPLNLPPILNLPVGLGLHLLGLLGLLLVIAYLTTCLLRRPPLLIRGISINLPTPALALSQVFLAALDLLLTCTALYVLLPADSRLSLSIFVGLYFLALLLGLASNVPGGLGVFESAMLVLLAPYDLGAPVITGLLVFRFVYYLFPLVLAALLLGAIELWRRRAGITKLAGGVGRLATTLSPQVMALAVFTGGAILLFSGALPAIGSRLAWLTRLVPLPVIEFSHFFGSLAGLGLLVLASGLRHRLRMAYFFSLILLGGGIILSVFKGGDFEEAGWLTLLFLALIGCRGEFRRRASLLAEPLSPGWLAAVLMVVAGSIWLGFFSYRHQAYSGELWWHFSLHGDAPRFLRATVGVLSTGLFLAMLRLLQPAQPDTAPPTPDDLEQAAGIAAESTDTKAYLALLGDKSLLFSQNRDAFLMYAVQGRCWIAMGDPIGPAASREELLWQFRNLCDEHGGWPVFYEVGKSGLGGYIDLGLNLLKLGEEGRVKLAEFTLEGSERKGLRYIHHRLQREGFTFTILPAAEVRGQLPVLAEVSRAWLSAKKTKEKVFSLGSFKEEYLCRFPVALVKQGENVVAFANLWLGGNRQELSIDLMRHRPDAPGGIMDFLFASIMLWGREQDYQWFSFGMAPLSGLEQSKAGALWGNIGAFIYRHGEHFYNFQGLREYKDKFDPVWEAKYLAYPGAFTLPTVFLNLTTLIGGGLKGTLGKKA